MTAISEAYVLHSLLLLRLSFTSALNTTPTISPVSAKRFAYRGFHLCIFYFIFLFAATQSQSTPLHCILGCGVLITSFFLFLFPFSGRRTAQTRSLKCTSETQPRPVLPPSPSPCLSLVFLAFPIHRRVWRKRGCPLLLLALLLQLVFPLLHASEEEFQNARIERCRVPAHKLPFKHPYTHIHAPPHPRTPRTYTRTFLITEGFVFFVGSLFCSCFVVCWPRRGARFVVFGLCLTFFPARAPRGGGGLAKVREVFFFSC
jgi:hypothetical protein